MKSFVKSNQHTKPALHTVFSAPNASAVDWDFQHMSAEMMQDAALFLHKTGYLTRDEANTLFKFGVLDGLHAETQGNKRDLLAKLLARVESLEYQLHAEKERLLYENLWRKLQQLQLNQRNYS